MSADDMSKTESTLRDMIDDVMIRSGSVLNQMELILNLEHNKDATLEASVDPVSIRGELERTIENLAACKDKADYLYNQLTPKGFTAIIT